MIESEEHKAGKNALCSFFKSAYPESEIQCEKVFGSVKADVFVSGNISMALEYQCSSLKLEELRLRCESYSCQEIPVMWVLSVKRYGKVGMFDVRRLSDIEKYLNPVVYFHSSWNHLVMVDWEKVCDIQSKYRPRNIEVVESHKMKYFIKMNGLDRTPDLDSYSIDNQVIVEDLKLGY